MPVSTELRAPEFAVVKATNGYANHHDASKVDAPAVRHDLVAVLFAASAPVPVLDLSRVLELPIERVERTLEQLAADPPDGLAIQRDGEHVALTTAPSAAAAVERYLGSPAPVRLSKAALEALAIIAYRQPVTRGEIDAVRGVNSDSAVGTLLARGLVAELGRRETLGRPALLGTTPDFLQYLGLSSLDDLPPLLAGG